MAVICRNWFINFIAVDHIVKLIAGSSDDNSRHFEVIVKILLTLETSRLAKQYATSFSVVHECHL
jgi:hypothetical protein